MSARRVRRTTIVQGAELFPSPVIWIPLTGASGLSVGLAALFGKRPSVVRSGSAVFLRTSFEALDDHGVSGVAGGGFGLEFKNGVGASGADCATAGALHDPYSTSIDSNPKHPSSRRLIALPRPTSSCPARPFQQQTLPAKTHSQMLPLHTCPASLGERYWKRFHQQGTVRRLLAEWKRISSHRARLSPLPSVVGTLRAPERPDYAGSTTSKPGPPSHQTHEESPLWIQNPPTRSAVSGCEPLLRCRSCATRQAHGKPIPGHVELNRSDNLTIYVQQQIFIVLRRRLND